MILDLIFSASITIFEWFVSLFPVADEIPNFSSFFSSFAGYFATINIYFPIDTLFTAVLLVISFEVVMAFTFFIRWLIAKIPAVGGVH